MEWFLFGCVGIAAGFLGGLLGIGGGVITVPFLYLMLTMTGQFDGKVMQIAVSTSLAAAICTSGMAASVQWRKKAISFSVVRLLAPGLIIGCIAGSITGHFLSSYILRAVFGAAAILLGIYFSVPRLPHFQIRPRPDGTLSLFGLGIGWLSSMLGIGGGSMTFPILLGYRLSASASSASSSLATFLSTLTGTIAYLMIGRHVSFPDTIGYIDLPAFASITLGSLITTPLGVKLSHVWHVSVIKRVFGLSLCVVGLTMLVL